MVLWRNSLLVGRAMHMDKKRLVNKLASRMGWNATEEGIQLPKGKPSIEISDRPAVMLSYRGDHIYGHWIIDFLPRIAVTEAAGFSRQDVLWLISGNAPAFVEVLLTYLGIPLNCIQRLNFAAYNYKVKNLILPATCRYDLMLSTFATRIFDQMVSLSKIDNAELYDKLFISRRRWQNSVRRLVNFTKVRDVLVAQGFTEVCPEQMPVPQQIALFSNARFVVGEAGSGPHNSAFGGHDQKVLVMQANTSGNFLQSAIGDIRQQQTGYVFGPAFQRPGNANRGDYLVDCDLLETQIRKHM
jgi:capsular polysaccharide biosynthesis protein